MKPQAYAHTYINDDCGIGFLMESPSQFYVLGTRLKQLNNNMIYQIDASFRDIESIKSVFYLGDIVYVSTANATGSIIYVYIIKKG